MRKQRRGHIVNVASVVGKIAFPFHGAYSATKFAMIAMTEALRGELDGSGVTATVVLPASTRTEFFEAQRTNDGHVRPHRPPAERRRRRPRHRPLRPKAHPRSQHGPRLPLRLRPQRLLPRPPRLAGRQFYRRSHGKPRRKST